MHTTAHISDNTRARQWTVTLHVQPEEQDQLELDHADMCNRQEGSLMYCFLGGLEKTDTSNYHLHAIYKFKHPRMKKSLIDIFKLDKYTPYATPTDSKPVKYYVMHHAKQETKVDINKRMLFEWPSTAGIYEESLNGKQWTSDRNCSTTGRQCATDKWMDAMELAKQGKLEPSDDCTKSNCCVYHKYPKIYLDKRQALYALHPVQNRPKGCIKQDHLWIYGPTGCGKTSSVYALFQQEGLYRRDITKQFWQSYAQEPNVVIEDMNNSTLRQLQLTTLKNLCDPTGFPIEQKYGNSEIIRPRIIVTSQYSIDECVRYVGKNAKFNQDWYHEEDLNAIKRRFRCIHFYAWLREQNLQVVSQARKKQLDEEECDDPMKYLEPYNIEHPSGRDPFEYMHKRQREIDDAEQGIEDAINHASTLKNMYDYDGQRYDTFSIDKSKSYPFNNAKGSGVIYIGHCGAKRFKFIQYKIDKDMQVQCAMRETDSDIDSEEHLDDY